MRRGKNRVLRPYRRFCITDNKIYTQNAKIQIWGKIEGRNGIMITIGDILDLIDKSREGIDVIQIMNPDSGEVEMSGVISSKLWKPLENRVVNSIQADGKMLMTLWIEREE